MSTHDYTMQSNQDNQQDSSQFNVSQSCQSPSSVAVDVSVTIHQENDEERDNENEERSRCLPLTSNNNNFNTGLDDETIPPPPSYSQIPGTVPLHTGRNNGPPPSYDEAVNPNIAPPSYQSLFGQVKEARKSASRLRNFVRAFFGLLFDERLIKLGFRTIIPVTMIIMGATHMDQCPAENMVPKFLVIGSFVWLIKIVLHYWAEYRSTKLNDPESIAQLQKWYGKRTSWLDNFLFVWFIVGCINVYRIYPPNYEDPDSFNYCNKLLYFYALWLVSLYIIGFGLFIGCVCCFALTSALTTYMYQG